MFIQTFFWFRKKEKEQKNLSSEPSYGPFTYRHEHAKSKFAYLP